MNRKVILSNRSVYHKYAEIEIGIPSSIKSEDIGEWINNNLDVYTDALDYQVSEAPYEFGFGVDGAMNEVDSDSETRFDVVVDEKKVNGGHL